MCMYVTFIQITKTAMFTWYIVYSQKSLTALKEIDFLQIIYNILSIEIVIRKLTCSTTTDSSDTTHIHTCSIAIDNIHYAYYYYIIIIIV